MTFLNSALLAALSLGLIPILIHLLNRQRFKQVDFPTLRFLQEMQRQKMRRIRVRQWILLALRTLAVLALVLAMARPVLKSEVGILGGGDARTSVVLVLDRSASMSTESEGGTRFRDLQLRAQELIQFLGANDEIQIVWADASPKVFPDSPTQHRTLIRETVESSTVTEASGSITEALGVARSLLGQSQNLLKEVYLLSDFSGSAWPEQLPQASVLPDDVKLYLVKLGTESSPNVGIASAEITSRLIAPGRPVELTFSVANTGNDDSNDRIVSVYLDGKRVAQTRVSINAGESRTEQIKFVPESVGELTGYVRLEDTDAFAGDDIRRYVLRVPARLNAAIVGANGPARRLTSLALDPSGRGESFVHPLELTSAELEGEDWSTFDVIFVVDATAFSSSFQERAQAYLQSGRGIFVAGGPSFEIRSHAAWMQSIGLPAPVNVEPLGNPGARWSKVDLDHPLFEGIFQEKPADVSPDFKQRLFVSRGVSTASSVIEGTDGKPLMLEATQGRGRALFLASSPDPEWSSLYRSGIFSPLMNGCAAYLAGYGGSGAQFAASVDTGTEVILRNSEQLQYELTKETSSQKLTAIPVTGGQLLKIPPLPETGDYILRQDTRSLRPVVVNVSERESNITPMANDELLALLGGEQMILSKGQNVQTAIREGRFGRELWKFFLYLALGLLVLEMLIARTPKQDVLVPMPS